MHPSASREIAPTQGATFLPDGSIEWRIWSPYHDSVTLVVWQDGRRSEFPMHRDASQFHCCRLPGGDTALRYAYRIPECGMDLPDPLSRWQPDGVHRASAILDPLEFEWHDAEWQGTSMSGLVIYECHVGTFTAEGTFDAIIPRLASLAELGVSALEIMPVGQFPGERNWGYDGVHPFAVQNTYGGPFGLQRLVDAAHRHGLAVILDVVYNHFGPEGNYFGMFGPYFTDRYSTPWGKAVNYDGPDCGPVRQMVLDNARMWIRDFHIDGLRLDAVHAIYDFSDVHILAPLHETVTSAAEHAGRRAVVIAESDRHDFWNVHPLEAGGAGLDGVWHDDFHHALHALLTGERHWYYADFGKAEHLADACGRGLVMPFRSPGAGRRRHPSLPILPNRSSLVISVQNHDQIGNRPCGQRLTTLMPPAAARLAAGLLLVLPDTPLLFMGEEYGETRPFPFFCSFGEPDLIAAVARGRRADLAATQAPECDKAPDPQKPSTFTSATLTWKWPQGTQQAGRRQWYSDLLALRRRLSPLRNRQTVAASLVPTGKQPISTCLVLELSTGRNNPILVVANLSDRRCIEPPLLPRPWNRILSSEDPRYGGMRGPGDDMLLPFELQVLQVVS